MNDNAPLALYVVRMFDNTIYVVLDQPGHDIGWLEWTASIVGSLAWPIAAIVMAAIFHKHIVGLLSRLAELSWGDKSAKFARQADAAETQLEVVEAAQPVTVIEAVGAASGSSEVAGTSATALEEESRTLQLLSASPAAAVLDAWLVVEKAMRDLAKRHGRSKQLPDTVFNTARDLKSAGVLNTEAMVMLADLRKGRNLAVHGHDVDLPSARLFVRVASRFRQILDAL